VISMVAPTLVLATRIAARSITISPSGGDQLPFSGVSWAIVSRYRQPLRGRWTTRSGNEPQGRSCSIRVDGGWIVMPPRGGFVISPLRPGSGCRECTLTCCDTFVRDHDA
jgi:hypothetical protein